MGRSQVEQKQYTLSLGIASWRKRGRPTKHAPAFCIYLKVLPCLQQGPTPKSLAPGLPSPLWLCQSHPTTSATVLTTAATACYEPPHTCAALGSSWQVPSPTHPTSTSIYSSSKGLAPVTVPPPLPIFSSSFPPSLGGTHGAAPTASLLPGIQASLYPVSLTTMAHRNCKTQILSSQRSCHTS